MSESIVQNTCRAKVAPSKYEQTPFTTHLGPKLDPVHVIKHRWIFEKNPGLKVFPVHISRHHSKHIWGQSWTQHISADTIQDTSRAKVGPSTCHQTSLNFWKKSRAKGVPSKYQQTPCKTHVGPKLDPVHVSSHRSKHFLGQSWTQYMSADMVWNILRAKVRLSKYQQASFKTHLGPKLNPVHVSRHPSKHIQGQSWTQ